MALHPADQQIQEINHSGIQRTDPYQAGGQCREVLQANTEMPGAKTADMEGKAFGCDKNRARQAGDFLQYQNPLTEKQKNTESAEERSGFQLNRDAVDSVMENGAISAEKLCRRCMHKRFTPQEKNGNRNQKKAAPKAEGGDLGEVEFKRRDAWQGRDIRQRRDIQQGEGCPAKKECPAAKAEYQEEASLKKVGQ